MRQQQKKLLKDYIEGEMVPLKFSSTAANGYNMKPVPFVKVNNLCDMIFDYLDRLQQ